MQRYATVQHLTAARSPIMPRRSVCRRSFLVSLGVQEIRYLGSPALRIPYFDTDGGEAAIRFRIALQGDDRFRWKHRAKSRLYGLNRITHARAVGYVALPEGESDCQTLWFHSFPALGLPGAGNWNEDRDAPLLDGFDVIYLMVEADQGGGSRSVG